MYVIYHSHHIVAVHARFEELAGVADHESKLPETFLEILGLFKKGKTAGSQE